MFMSFRIHADVDHILSNQHEKMIMKDFVLKYSLDVKAAAVRAKTRSMINIAYVVEFICGTCHHLLIKVLKQKNTGQSIVMEEVS